MTFPQPEGSSFDSFTGFEGTRRLMTCCDARVRTRDRLSVTDFPADRAILVVHVDNIARADRVFLTVFDHQGRHISAHTLYTDEPGQHLNLTPEFDHE